MKTATDLEVLTNLLKRKQLFQTHSGKNYFFKGTDLHVSKERVEKLEKKGYIKGRRAYIGKKNLMWGDVYYLSLWDYNGRQTKMTRIDRFIKDIVKATENQKKAVR